MARHKIGLGFGHVKVVAAGFCAYLAHLVAGVDVPEADQRILRSCYRLLRREDEPARCDQV